MDSSGNGSEERAFTFARLLGVRDGSSRDATTAEMTKVAKNLYFFLVMRYHEGIKSGKWAKWDEETHFPRDSFQSHSSRTNNNGVFGGFDFTKWAELKLVNGVEGTKAVEVSSGPIKKKMVMWEAPLCGSGLENSIKEAIDDHLNEQGAMTAAACKKKKANIWDQITVFHQCKEMRWCGDQQKQMHLFGSGQEQKKMKKYCGKKVGVDWYILMLKDDGAMSN